MLVHPLYKEDEKGCWVWQRGTCNGYGWYGRKYAHRVMYETHIGGLTKTIFLHHKCHNKMCVNPYHLVKTTTHEHQKHHQKEQEYCKNGHLRQNLYVTKEDKWQCRECKNIRQKGYDGLKAASRRQARLDIIEGVREDYGKLPIKEIAAKYGIGWRSIYRYIKATPTKLGYF